MRPFAVVESQVFYNGYTRLWHTGVCVQTAFSYLMVCHGRNENIILPNFFAVDDFAPVAGHGG
jgi:hypothetical protein